MPSPSPSVKIQIIAGKVYLTTDVKRQNIAALGKQTFENKKLLTTPNNILPLYLKQTFRS